MIFADVEMLVQALRMQPQQQTLYPAAREASAKMTDALTSMRAMQQVQQQGPTPVTPMTPTVTQGTEPFQEMQVTQEAVLREAMRQAENIAVGQSPQGSRTPLEGRKRPTTEELREGLENDLGEKWTEIDESEQISGGIAFLGHDTVKVNGHRQIRRDRWFVQANERQQQVALSGSTRNQRSGVGAWVKAAPTSEKTRCWTNPMKGQYAYEWASHSHS